MSDKVDLSLDLDRVRRERDDAREIALMLLDALADSLAMEITHPMTAPQAEEATMRLSVLVIAREAVKEWKD